MTRREWAFNSLAAAWQHAHQATQSGSQKFTYLAPADAKEIEALAAQIIPTDSTPGAREAGAIHFIDHVLATWDSGKRDAYRKGLQMAQGKRRELFPQSASLAALNDAQARQLLASIEKTEFFEVLRTHTVLAYFGTRGGPGWAHIGMEDRMSFEPPFGYYDAEEARR